MSEQDRDRGQLLSIFSAEVWLLILENVKNGADFQRISNASPYFRTLLRPRATQALFPEGLQIMKQQQPPLLSPKELLPCRLVCHAWKVGVERALHDPEHLLLSEGEQEERQDLMNLWSQFDGNLSTHQGFETVADFARFQQHFRASHQGAGVQGNPFFCQFVRFGLPTRFEHFPPYLKACLEFLETYGTHIRYCSIDMNYGNHNVRQFYGTSLKQILGLMPNLRVCEFDSAYYTCTSRTFQQQVHRYLEASPTPMPELKHLHKISGNGLALAFLRALVQRNPQVSRVSGDWPPEGYIKFYLEEMPNLTRLEVNLLQESRFQEFQRAAIACQLSTLHLQVEDKLLAKNGLQRLFAMLEAQFAGTLTELLVDGKPRVTSRKEQEALKLRLPHLKKFTFIMAGRIIPLDFMLPLENTLEELTVGADGYPNREPETPFSKEQARKADKTLKLYEFWVDLKKSNVWVLFPKLKLLKVTEGPGDRCICTREQWMAV